MARFNTFPLEDIATAIDRVGPSWDTYRGARIFITGGSGFLGQWLVAVLLRANDRLDLGLTLSVLVRETENLAAIAPDLAAHPALRIVPGDVRSFDFPPGSFTHLIHAATDSSLYVNRQWLLMMEVILDGTRRVLDFAAAAGVKTVLFISSGAVYGAQPADMAQIPETYAGACPTDDVRSTYGQCKRAAEQMMTVYRQTHGIDTRIARGFAFVGPGMDLDGGFAVGNFIRDRLRGHPLRILGDGQPRRSYLYASDTAVWLLRILAEGEPGGIYNVGSDREFSIADIARTVATSLGGGRVVIDGAPQDGFRSRYIPDIAKARALGLAVWTPLDQAIRNTADWARAYRMPPSD
jgi:dTDP-glucose 4,6-dehydratase